VGPQDQSGRVWKISLPPGFDPPNRTARSESLRRLSYPGPSVSTTEKSYSLTTQCTFEIFLTVVFTRY